MKKYWPTLCCTAMLLFSNPALLYAKSEIGAVDELIGDNIVGWIYTILAYFLGTFVSGFFDSLFGGSFAG
ncbi:MAG: hypothetical protein HJJLKODD_00856 [Phycisphaerae bacterium]|nr:hypothetical protein [Phycisphaerae bacterium]